MERSQARRLPKGLLCSLLGHRWDEDRRTAEGLVLVCERCGERSLVEGLDPLKEETLRLEEVENQ